MSRRFLSLWKRLDQFLGTEKARRRRAVQMIEDSGLFDRKWYLNNYRDVEASSWDPVLHYVQFGWKEGRDPGPQFSTVAYLRANDDVARAGANPLLHYVEHGHSEGRGGVEFGTLATSGRLPRETFGPAAPCARFPVPSSKAPCWRRAWDVNRSAADEIQIDGAFLCVTPNREDIVGLQSAFHRLSLFSGETASDEELHSSPDRPPTLTDAWFEAGRLRTRWRAHDAEPFVVRAVGHAGATTKICGEGLVIDSLDMVEATPANSLFPVLFVFTTPEGLLQSWLLLTFPSLLRGGPHYPEMLVLAQGGTGDRQPQVPPIEISSALERKLIALRQGSTPLLCDIVVDITRGDGRDPLFQPEFRTWLAKVAGISMAAAPGAEGQAQDYLAQAVRLDAGRNRSAGSFTLCLDADTFPAISALMATAASDEGQAQGSVSMAISSVDSSKPTIFLAASGADDGQGLGNSPRPFPRFRAGRGARIPQAQLPLTALRVEISRRLTDADMLKPIAEAGMPAPDGSATITWLIGSPEHREQEALECIQAIAEQVGSVGSVIFVGTPSAAADALARQLLRGRVRTEPDLRSAARVTNTPLAAFVDAAVVLHDRRTAAVLSRLIQEGNAATASAVIVAPEQRGKDWLVNPADVGELRAEEAAVGHHHLKDLASVLWRGVWPMSLPPQSLWLSRTADLVEWTRSGRNEQIDRPHLCSFQISASFSSVTPAPPNTFNPPRGDSAAIKASLLFG